jgi:prevent-host-death family protein
MPKSARKYSSHRKTAEEVAVTAFKDSCLRLIDRVHHTREEIIVTKYGQPVAKLVPFEENSRPLFGSLAGSITVHGDLVAPLNIEWNADA